MPTCVFHDAETGESRPVFSPVRRGRPTAQVPASLLSVSRTWTETGELILLVKGRLDLNTVLSFRDSVFSALGEHPKRLLVDLTPVHLIEATGIATLVTLARVAQMVGVPCDFKPSPELAQVFEETGLSNLMVVMPPDSTEIARRILIG